MSEPTNYVSAIPDALLKRFATLVVSSPNIDLVTPYEKYDPQDDVPYIEAQHFPNASTSRLLSGGPSDHEGFLQVTVVTPLRKGIIPPNEIAGLVIDHFKKDTLCAGVGVVVKIIQQPYAAQAVKDGATLRVPVTIPYICSA